ncbi:MAG: hypothetical protein LBB91_00185 [Clostridiales bacterium]|nr:hypothetical protein [Clostridiales bacterium]
MKKSVVVVMLLILLMSGCTTQNQHVEDVENSVANWTTVFTFEASVAEQLPTFTFEVQESKHSNREYFIYTYKIDIFCLELEDYTSQSIEIYSGLKWEEEHRKDYIDLVDIDFDGFADIQVRSAMGTVNSTYDYYRWNVFVERGYGIFEEEPFFGMLATGYKLYPDTKQIISSSRDWAVNHPREMYQLSNTRNGGWQGTYEMIRHEWQDMTRDENDEYVLDENGEYSIIAHIFFGDEEIYTYPWGEGFDDYTEISDNYLRFGIANPISIETALNLLRGEYGEADSETGFRYSFMFEEMYLYENLSCYKFRVQWLVDNSHWSTVDFVGVTPDGRIFNAVDN